MENLEQELRNMYENSKKGYKIESIILFGIKNSSILKNLENVDLIKIAENATGKLSYATEIRKGIKLYDLLENEK
ncbi:hypothetical protein JCM11957_10360 [Caminibacter profundus]